MMQVDFAKSTAFLRHVVIYIPMGIVYMYIIKHLRRTTYLLAVELQIQCGSRMHHVVCVENIRAHVGEGCGGLHHLGWVHDVRPTWCGGGIHNLCWVHDIRPAWCGGGIHSDCFKKAQTPSVVS